MHDGLGSVDTRPVPTGRHLGGFPLRIPDSTKGSLELRPGDRQRARWSQLAQVHVCCRGPLACVDAVLLTGEVWPLCRLRFGGYASAFGDPSAWVTN